MTIKVGDWVVRKGERGLIIDRHNGDWVVWVDNDHRGWPFAECELEEGDAMKNELGLSNEEIAGIAAKFCYSALDDATAPVAWVIERFVLPDVTKGYSEEDMAGYIQGALEGMRRREGT